MGEDPLPVPGRCGLAASSRGAGVRALRSHRLCGAGFHPVDSGGDTDLPRISPLPG